MENMQDQALVELDGVGGAVLLVRGEVHRRGANFAAFRKYLFLLLHLSRIKLCGHSIY